MFHESLPMEQVKRYCPKCLIKESRKGQRYCKTCHSEYMKERRKLMFTFNQINTAFNRETMNKSDFIKRLYE